MLAIKSFLVFNKSYELKEDEFLKDGIIYCKKCKTPRISISPGGTQSARCICECQKQEFKKQMEEQRAIHKQRQIEHLKEISMIGKRYKDVSFEKTLRNRNKTFETAFERCKKYCSVSKQVLENGYGIYIFGDKGTGKTHLTACMCNELINSMQQVLFTNFLEISKIIRSTFNNYESNEFAFINELANIDFLFIDDLGVERVQNNLGDLWLQEKVFDIINKRYNNKKPTVFTSNYSLKELINDRGFAQRTVDRICEMSNAVLKIEGNSFRMNTKVEKLPF